MLKKIFSLALLPLAWPVFCVSRVFNRDPQQVVFGTHTASFSGNVRALIEEPCPGLHRTFISANKSLIAAARKAGVIAHHPYSFQGITSCLRAGSYVYSNYPSDISYWLSGGARYINVWHGTPLKEIERDISKGRYSYRNKYRVIFKVLAPYLLAKPDVLLVSSPYEAQCFQSAFEVSNGIFFRAFPPRLRTLASGSSAGTGRLNLLFAPTWRDDHNYSASRYINWKSFNAFLETHGMHLKVKLHPSDLSGSAVGSYPSIETIDSGDDIYHHLERADLIITDYSSVLFDALYVEKRVVLFTPDRESYVTSNRGLYIDAESLLGSKGATSQMELQDLLRQASKAALPEVKLPDRYMPYTRTMHLLRPLIEKALSNHA